jgi:hypothetical protein
MRVTTGNTSLGGLCDATVYGIIRAFRRNPHPILRRSHGGS